jgi:hypothetical protein
MQTDDYKIKIDKAQELQEAVDESEVTGVK